MDSDELGRALSFASSCAAFTCGRAGADPPRGADISIELSRLFPNRLKRIETRNECRR
jgi:fructokinase